MKKILLKNSSNTTKKIKLNPIKKILLKPVESKDNKYNLKNLSIVSSKQNKNTGGDLYLELSDGRNMVAYYFNLYDSKGKKLDKGNGV